MGVFRFLLAALVVLFHFGGLSWIVGRVAVFAFYCISGFLIFQVLDRVYLDERAGAARFLANRFVRLAPLYLAYALMTAALIHAGAAPALTNAGVHSIDASARQMLRSTVTLSPSLEFDGRLPVLAFDAPLLPQGWSIGVEASFYLVAPLVVLATRRRPTWITVWTLCGLAITAWGFRVAGVDFDRLQSDVYKNSVASVAVFFLGGACYYVRRRWGAVIRAPLTWGAVAVWLAFLTVPQLSRGALPPSPTVLAHQLWLTLIMTCVVLLSAPLRFRALDRMAGNLCYGVYLNHFLAATLLSLAGSWVDIGRIGTLRAGALVLLASMLLAGLTYLLIERPFDLVRSRVRGAAVPPAPAPATHPHTGLVTAIVTVLVLFAAPIGWGVEQLNGAASGESLPLSAVFDIRWKPDVSDVVRQRIEAEFDLVVDGPVVRDPRHRTYQYRLPHPSKARVKALITHPAVEDTARVDVERYAIAP